MSSYTVTRRPGHEPVSDPVREYRLLTPLMGGGAEAGVPDEDFPVNGKAVRGQLRFWWRALRGGQFGGDLLVMQQRERALFGGVALTSGGQDQPSRFSLTVLPDPGAALSLMDVPGLNTSLGYLAFALRDKVHPVTGRPVRLMTGVQFTLELTWDAPEPPTPEDRLDLEAALWAWETFGGVGARTRRGFGAVSRLGQPEAADLDGHVERQLRRFLTPGPWPGGVPHLSLNEADRVVRRSTRTPESEHELLAGLLKTFRRSTEGNAARGATLWPEPYSLSLAPSAGPQSFPRAALGLPIVFDKKGELNGTHVKRLASPVLFRPLRSGTQTYRVAVRLRSEPTDADPLGADGRLTVTINKKPYPGQRFLLTEDEAAEVPLMNDSTDVAAAFLNTLRT